MGVISNNMDWQSMRPNKVDQIYAQDKQEQSGRRANKLNPHSPEQESVMHNG